MSSLCNDLFFISHSAGNQNPSWTRAKYGFLGNKPLHAAPQDCRQDEIVALRLQRELCSIIACLLRVSNSVRGLTCCFSFLWILSALWDKWNEGNHLGDCSQAIDFMGHQITPGLAEHMPFSTRRRLSFSRINSSNYPAPPTAINSEPVICCSRNRNEEADAI